MERILKIWISRTDKIGDLILSIPCFFMLRKMYPEAKISILVNSYNADIVRYLPYINEIIVVDQIQKAALIQKAKQEKVSIFVALYSDWFIANLAWQSGATIRVGNLSKIYSFLFYNKGIRQNRSKSTQHETQYNLDLIRAINPNLYDACKEWNNWIYPNEESKQIAHYFYAQHQLLKPIVIHPFNGGSAENLTPENYMSLLRALRHKIENPILLIGQKQQEKDLQTLEQTANIKNLFIYANEGSILNTAAIIARAEVFIGTSTGTTHIANSAGKKIIGLYPCNLPQTSIKRWGLLGNLAVKYIFPDEKEKKEKTRSNYFKNYNSAIEEEIVQSVVSFL